MEIKTLSEINKDHKMIWIEDPMKYEYVREGSFLCHHPLCKPITSADHKRTGEILIGYEKPIRDPGSSDRFPIFTSVFYWLKNHDRGMPGAYGERGYGNRPEIVSPSEAVKITGG